MAVSTLNNIIEDILIEIEKLSKDEQQMLLLN